MNRPDITSYGFGVSVAGTSVGTMPGGAEPGVVVILSDAAGVAASVGVGVGSYGGAPSHATS